MFDIWLARVSAVLLAVAFSVPGCSTNVPEAGPPGSLQMSLELPGNVSIDEVEYEISGNGITPIGGLIDTTGPGTTVTFSVVVPAGQGYLLGLNAESTDGGHSCRGTAPFDMQAGHTTNVSVTLTCKRTGDLHVSGGFNHCAEVSQPFVSATQMTVGESIQLSVVGVDEEDDPIEYSWLGSGGVFNPTDAAMTSYSCAEPGLHTLGVVLSDDGFVECAEGWTTDIECTGGSPTYPTDAILVSTSGLDGPLCGTDPADPCATITYGIVRANDEPSMNGVAVSQGTYVEHVVLIAGIDVLGGYSPDFATRDIGTFLTTLRVDPNSPQTVTANGITSPTLFEGFTVMAPSNNQPSMDSVGIHVFDSTSVLRIENNVIIGGSAGDGVSGVSGTDGLDGAPGYNGFGPIRIYTADPDPGPRAGGEGGSLTVNGTDISGGAGADSTYPLGGIQNGSGASGQGPVAALGGDGGWNWSLGPSDCSIFLTGGNPHDGLVGADGADGAHGSAGVAGIAGVGVSTAGGDGDDGDPGSGAGGGGAAGGLDTAPVCETTEPLVAIGGGGGGGGSGAGAGTAGLGGSGGGSTFGVFVQGTGAPTLVNNSIYLGAAGDGGVGGQGGAGGLGADGGLGGLADPPYAGAAGNGGKGGDGGHGGGGGGGAGGLSIGIYATFDATGTYDVDNLIDVGTGIAGLGGAGGLSLGNSGQQGQDGQVLAVLFQP